MEETKQLIELKFSRLYDKMPDDLPEKETYLLGVFPFFDNCCSKAFLEYDTRYNEGGQVKHYELPEGKKIMLLLGSKVREPNASPSNFELWTTLRSWNPEKEEYYKKHLGEEIKLIVTE